MWASDEWSKTLGIGFLGPQLARSSCFVGDVALVQPVKYLRDMVRDGVYSGFNGLSTCLIQLFNQKKIGKPWGCSENCKPNRPIHETIFTFSLVGCKICLEKNVPLNFAGFLAALETNRCLNPCQAVPVLLVMWYHAQTHSQKKGSQG